MVNKNILNVKVKGLPAKNYYYINTNELIKYLSNVRPSPNNFLDQDLRDVKDLTLENNRQIIINNNKENNNNYIYSRKDDTDNELELKKQKEEHLLKENIICIIDYLNATANTKYKYTTKGTIKLIKAKFNEGYVLDDFYDVIDKKWADWKNSEWEKYMRPETLFGNKFESYLNGSKFTGKPKISYNCKPNFDNTAEHILPKPLANMTGEEKENFKNTQLAKDENGNFIKF